MNKVLEALLVIYNSQDIMGGYDDFWKAFRVIEKAIKVLEIIKKKRVDITTLFDCRDAQEYNRWVGVRSHYSYRPFEITQEEFEILKEVLL